MSGNIYGDDADDPDAEVVDGVTRRRSPFDTTTRQTSGDWPDGMSTSGVYGYPGHGAYDVSSNIAYDGSHGVIAVPEDPDHGGGHGESHGDDSHDSLLAEGYGPDFDAGAEAAAGHGGPDGHGDGGGDFDGGDHGVPEFDQPGTGHLSDFESDGDGDGDGD
jgi:hypothetical protein